MMEEADNAKSLSLPQLASRVQTRAGKRTRVRRNISETEDDSTGVAHLAPTATLSLQKQKHELEIAKQKMASQEDMIMELTRERDYLREQLSQSLKTSSKSNEEPSPVKVASNSSLSSEASYSSSTDDYSDSSSYSSSMSSDDGKKRRKGKRKKSDKNVKKTKKKGKKQTRGKESKRTKRCCFSRARGPTEVVQRYVEVLRINKKKKSITAACKKIGVDRNTIALNAPIAELAIAAPGNFAELREQHSIKEKLGDFAGKCLDTIRSNLDIEDKVQALKRSGNYCLLGRAVFK